MSTGGNTEQNNFEQDHNKMISPERWLIDHSEGCVFAIVTAETNITNLLSVKIQNILLTNSVLPENILCITGTGKSSRALSGRLQNLIGQDASRINISTFSEFCEKLVSEDIRCSHNPLVLISARESTELFKKLIAALPNGNPLKRYRSDVFHEIKNLMNLFSLMKREGLTAEHPNEKTDALLKEVATSDEPSANMQTAHHAGEKKMFEKLKAGISEFDHYQKHLQTNNRYDAEDLVSLAVNALEENQSLLSAYRQKYKYIVVEGYPIISYQAAKLLPLLTRGNEHFNILLIGYAEQVLPGADALHIKHWPLTNIESGKWTVILPGQPGSSTSPMHMEESNSEQTLPVIKSYHSEHEEMAAITNQVQELIHAGIDPGKIAVLYPNDDYCEQLEQYFILKKIPAFISRDIDILEHPFSEKIIQLLRYASSEHDTAFSGDELLFEILHFDLFKIPPGEIAKLSIEAGNKKSKSGIRKLLQEKVNAPAKDLFDTGIHKELKYVSLLLEKLISDVPRISLQQIFESVAEAVWLQNYIAEHKNSEWLAQLLKALADFITAEITRKPTLQLGELIASLDTMQKEHLPITVSNITGCIPGVHFVKAPTVNKMNFTYNFLTGCNRLLKQENYWPAYFYRLTNTNPFEPLINNLIYSGTASHVIISFIKYDSRGKELAPPPLIEKIASAHSIMIEDGKLSDVELKEYTGLDEILQPEIEHLEQPIISAILNKFVMSVSALNNYLDCPLGFYYKNIIRVPARKNEAMEFGSAVHDSLEKLFKKLTAGFSSGTKSSGPAQFISATNMVEDFKQNMQSRRTHFTDEAFKRRMEYGTSILHNYYDYYIGQWNKIVSAERNISGITINSVPVKGKLDKLEFDGKDVTIVDYKTGDIEKALSKMKPPDDDNPNGGDYWRQAVFYKMLVDNYEQKGWKVISIEFDFIEPDKDNRYRKEKIRVGPPDIETVTQQITETWAKIQRREFYTGCGCFDCHWCNFVKNNTLAIAWHTKQKLPFAD